MARPLQFDFADAIRSMPRRGRLFMQRFAVLAGLTVLSILIFANSRPSFAQPDSLYRVPAGTHIRLKLDSEINSRSSSVNDTFLATVARPVMIHDAVVLPTGTFVEGRVSDVTRAGAGGQPGKLDVVFGTMKISNQFRHIEGIMITPIRAQSSRRFAFLSILGGLGGGAAIGSAAGSGSGALIGAGIGAGLGTAVAMLRKGKDVRMRKGEEFEIELKKDVMLPVLDY